MFIEKLHDLEVEEGDRLTLECQSPYSKMSPKAHCTPPKFVTKLQDEEVWKWFCSGNYTAYLSFCRIVVLKTKMFLLLSYC